jgi:hypothetical protein
MGGRGLTPSARQLDMDDVCDGDHGGAGAQRSEFDCRP